ncbi:MULTISPECIES: hypothetical protein [Sphingopyxis]|uniref:hypothetical protein n=1 Tax=Sphingopyxis TaxID=165697 RepID=UPI0002FB55E6|nr:MULTISPECIES: hypothetical protein [Sphingopyxis]
MPTRHVARAVEDKLREVSGIAAPGMPRGRALLDAAARDITIWNNHLVYSDEW